MEEEEPEELDAALAEIIDPNDFRPAQDEDEERFDDEKRTWPNNWTEYMRKTREKHD